MADKKISALTAATVPLAGTEVLPIVQGGSTVKVPVSDLTAGRAVSGASFTTTVGNYVARNDYGLSFGTGDTYIWGSTVGAFIRLDVNYVTAFSVNSARNATVNVGNLVIGTAGKGIDFSANTHAAGMTKEVLDWYEEGTWTPVVFFGGANTGMNVAVSGHYTRIGRLVTVRCSVVFTAKGSSTGTFQISGLPYSGSIPGAGAMGFNYGWATMPSGGMTFAAISGSIYAMPANFGGYADDTYFGNGTAINDITITYMV